MNTLLKIYLLNIHIFSPRIYLLITECFSKGLCQHCKGRSEKKTREEGTMTVSIILMA